MIQQGGCMNGRDNSRLLAKDLISFFRPHQYPVFCLQFFQHTVAIKENQQRHKLLKMQVDRLVKCGKAVWKKWMRT
jgi:hypothetical protein